MFYRIKLLKDCCKQYNLSDFMFHTYLIIGTDDERNIFYIFILANISHFSLINTNR